MEENFLIFAFPAKFYQQHLSKGLLAPSNSRQGALPPAPHLKTCANSSLCYNYLMSINIDKAELKETIREVLREELLNLAASMAPYVSEAEMKDIEAAFSKKDFAEEEFVDGSAWLGS